MNKIAKLMSLGFVAFSLVATSCSDDKNEPNPGEEAAAKVDPATVFTNGLPTVVGDYVITKNDNGLVTKITSGDEVTTFNYTPSKSASRAASRPADYDMTMNVEWGDDSDGIDFYIKLNSQGYIEYAFEEDKDADEGISYDEWWFKYNGKGQLIEMKRTEGDNEVTTITYDANGNITSVSLKNDEDGQTMTATIGYTDATHSSPIPNKSGIMLYDDCFRIDMDEMAQAYYAGLLGKGTTNLPLTCKSVHTGYSDYYFDYSFGWEFNADNMPIKLETTYTFEGGSSSDEPIIFKW